MGEVRLRRATPGDAADLAILDNIAGHGISSWYWQGAVNAGKAEDAYDWGRRRFVDNEAIFGWKNAVIAEQDGLPLGAACSYLMPQQDPAGDTGMSGPLASVLELFGLAAGDWFVDSLAVYGQARGRGVGSKLLENCIAKASENGVGQISLVVEDSNEPALALYFLRGFTLRYTRPYQPFCEGSKTEHWLLLTKEIDKEKT